MNIPNVVKVYDSFIIASGRRKVVLARVADGIKPFANIVYSWRTSTAGEWNVISIAQYVDLDVARMDFEKRRPHMRDASDEDFEMPMQKGKRLIQEVMKEKLG